MYEFKGTKGLTLAENSRRKKKLVKSEATSEVNDRDSSFGSVMFRSQINKKITQKGESRFNKTGVMEGNIIHKKYLNNKRFNQYRKQIFRRRYGLV